MRFQITLVVSVFHLHVDFLCIHRHQLQDFTASLVFNPPPAPFTSPLRKRSRLPPCVVQVVSCSDVDLDLPLKADVG